MKKAIILPVAVAIILLTGCRDSPDCNNLFRMVSSSFSKGDFRETARLADSLRKTCQESGNLLLKADSLTDISDRIRLDFSLNQADFETRIEKYFGKTSDSMLKAWEKNKWIEWRIIDGEKKYFNRAASNLILLKNFYEDREKQDLKTAADPAMTDRLRHTCEIVAATGSDPIPVVPVSMKITYTLTVDPDVVPDGEMIRCWLPYPKENHIRQTGVKLLSASVANYIIAPDSMVHRTLYMERTAEKGKPASFSISYMYTSSGIWFDMPGMSIRPYDRGNYDYKKYTSEQLPNICFSENVRRLSDEITAPGDAPEVIVKKIYMWFKNNIPWTGALEYSIIPSIPEYVYENRRGDCGMQTFMFMSMLRYNGIPVRWQSGWMVPPGNKNLHDWCEVYFEGPGWVPVDVSYDLQASDDRRLREFYSSGIDSYRLIVNDGVSGRLWPEKKFMRSEPYDFQRGEVEWKGGNLYFDKWDYSMQIEYLK